jgi:hypothetical protein
MENIIMGVRCSLAFSGLLHVAQGFAGDNTGGEESNKKLVVVLHSCLLLMNGTA